MASAEMALHSSEPSEAFHYRSDVDRLLAGYRATRAQEALFDLRTPGLAGPGVGYDEFVDPAGSVLKPLAGAEAHVAGEGGPVTKEPATVSK